MSGAIAVISSASTVMITIHLNRFFCLFVKDIHVLVTGLAVAYGCTSISIVVVDTVLLLSRTSRVTGYIPGFVNVCVGLTSLDVSPSPKVQSYEVMVPVLQSGSKLTPRGAFPDVGLAAKHAETCTSRTTICASAVSFALSVPITVTLAVYSPISVYL